MRDVNQIALLRAIAENYDDNVSRLVLADLLEETGDIARAEFVRVQTESATTTLSEKRRQELQVRERSLLDAHWHEWLQAFALPIEDVGFERGLISHIHLTKWDDGKLLDASHMPQLATLTELDLSDLALGDVGLAYFAANASFPALRRLILSNNEITITGAAALAQAAGLPRLETLYLHGNPAAAGARAVLGKAQNFRLANLDLGERADGYALTPGEADLARRDYIRTSLLPVVSKFFQTYQRLRSAMLCVAQYWADEADDAVHGYLILSELLEPTLDGVIAYGDEADANLPNTRIKSEHGHASSAISIWSAQAPWDDNEGAIPLWSAFAPEEGSQEYEYLKDVYRPAVLFYRHGGYDILPMCRPHLDGIRPQWQEE